MNRMDAVLPFALGIAMALTLLVLFVGIVTFAAGGKFNAKYSNKLMRLRVLFQGIAIAVFALAVWFSTK